MFRLACTAAALTLALLGAAQAQPAVPEARAPAAEARAVDPAAVQALARMGAALRALPAFHVHAQSSTDAVLDTGQNVAVIHRTDLDVRRPDRARARIQGNGADKGMVYDGRHFTLYTAGAPGRPGYFSTLPAPPDLEALVDWLARDYGIEPPLADLVYWGRSPDDASQLVDAQALGVDRIGGQLCHHYAFRQPGVDWELWVQAGARPLPCRLVLTDPSMVSRPRHQVDYTWTLAPGFAPGAFTFRPEPGARALPLEGPTPSEPGAPQ
ncbi:DUF2092 domain-containing protein [Bordetella genomosp. 1]|nr:DUF2092 domain-containing protein [Bordetella genomosp. 1]